MTRATPLSPDERRAALVTATRPLLLEHGLTVSTKQIAEAAGVAEGTIFRAFATKDELFCAVLQDALDPAPVVDGIRGIADLPLEETVARLIQILQASVAQVRALFMAISQTKPRDHNGKSHAAHVERDAAITAALIERLDRFDDQLRVSPNTAAWALKTYSWAVAHPFTADPAITEPRMVAALLLNGIAERQPC